MRRFLFFVLFLVLVASFGNEGWYRWVRLKRVEASLEEENRRLARENSDLKGEVFRLQEPLYVEKIVREELGFLKADEILYEESPQSP